VLADGSYARAARSKFEDPAQGRPTVEALGFDAVDAAHSAGLGRLIIASSQPEFAVHVVDPGDGSHTAIPLAAAPTALALSTDGMHAAVGHADRVTLLDLAGGTVTRTFTLQFSVLELAMTENGFIVLVPRDRDYFEMWSLDAATGALTPAQTVGLRNAIGSIGVHPDGKKLYGVTTRISPRDLERFSITGGDIAFAYESPYHGDYDVFGRVLFSPDGTRILVGAGTVFASSDVQQDDMVYVGALESGGQGFLHLDLAPDGGLAVGVPASLEVATVWLFDATRLTKQNEIEVPGFVVGRDYLAGRGRFAFFNGAASEIYVLVQADQDSQVVGLHRAAL
jgi:hypothetical protein